MPHKTPAPPHPPGLHAPRCASSPPATVLPAYPGALVRALRAALEALEARIAAASRGQETDRAVRAAAPAPVKGDAKATA